MHICNMHSKNLFFATGLLIAAEIIVINCDYEFFLLDEYRQIADNYTPISYYQWEKMNVSNSCQFNLFSFQDCQGKEVEFLGIPVDRKPLGNHKSWLIVTVLFGGIYLASFFFYIKKELPKVFSLNLAHYVFFLFTLGTLILPILIFLAINSAWNPSLTKLRTSEIGHHKVQNQPVNWTIFDEELTRKEELDRGRDDEDIFLRGDAKQMENYCPQSWLYSDKCENKGIVYQCVAELQISSRCKQDSFFQEKEKRIRGFGAIPISTFFLVTVTTWILLALGHQKYERERRESNENSQRLDRERKDSIVVNVEDKRG